MSTDTDAVRRARERRALADTALAASAGREVVRLLADPVDADHYCALVRLAGGKLVEVELDRRLGVATVSPNATLALQAA